MEELLQHCMRELAFDGDLGCNVSRLRQFIEGFYSSRPSSEIQTVDDAFQNFVWVLLVRQPSVHVGLVPQGETIEVYIAPQLSKKKTVAKPKKKQLVPESSPFPAVERRDTAPDDDNLEPFPGRLQSIPETATYSLDSLVRQYGNSLRVAVDPETCFRAITGSHARPAKLSPMVYTALQLISRGRESGLSVVDLGKKTGYDQKTCFYLVKQLLALDLVVKLGQGGPGGGNFCIHKYFYTHSAFWEGVRREGLMGEDNEHGDAKHGPTDMEASTGPQFDPIDSRHLASTQLIKTRIVKLLRNSENGLHSYQNLLITIGFVNPTRRDRRFFIHRIQELIKENIIEKVSVPKAQRSTRTLCIRLVEDHRTFQNDDIVVQPGDIGDEEQEAETLDDKDPDVPTMPVMNMTIHRQISKLLEEAGPKGLTLHNISTKLGMFDKRTVELLLYRSERYSPPSHLADLATCAFIENQGRERRHRYYTLPGYLSFIQDENIDDGGRTTRYTSLDISKSGGFYPLSDDLFYKDHLALLKFEDEFRNRLKPPKEGGVRKIGRPRKEGSKPKKSSEFKDKVTDSTRKPRGKGDQATGPIVPHEEDQGDGPLSFTEKAVQKGTKRKRKNNIEQDMSHSQPPPKKRSRQVGKLSQGDGHLPVAIEDDMVPTLQPSEVRENGHFPETPTVPSLERIDSRGTRPVVSSERHDEVMIGVAPNVQFTSEQLIPGPSSESFGQGTADASTNISHRAPSPAAPMDESVITSVQEAAPISTSGSLSLPRAEPMTNEPSFCPASESRIQGSVHIPENPLRAKRNRDPSSESASHFENRPVERPRSGRPKRTHELVNISQLRAENEIMRVVDESGGIANISSKEFFETYARVVSSMAEAGEPTSMPVGTQPDRRTIRKILERLVDRGRLKTLTATIAPRITQPRLAKLIYEPTMSQEKLDKYLTSVREGIPVLNNPVHKKLDQPVDYTRPKRRRTRDLVVTQGGILEGGNENEDWRRDLELTGDDDSAIRAIFLSEPQTVAQLYGYLVGRVRRARELHQITLAHLQNPDSSPYVVSQTERIVALPYYYHYLPISTYFAIVSATEYSPELSTLMETSAGRQTLVKDLPSALHDELKIGRARARDRLLVLLEVLTSLKLVTPLHPSNSATSYVSCEQNGPHPSHFDIAPMFDEKRTATTPPFYWRFNIIAPIYFYSQTSTWPPSFHRDMFVRTADESMPFWFELEDACLNKESLDPMASMDSITGPCACTSHVARELRRQRSWVSSYVLSRHQKQYLQHKWSNPLTGYTPLSDQDGGRNHLEYICSIISAPFDVVYNFFLTLHNLFSNEAGRIRKRDQRQREENQEHQTKKDRALLAKKAAKARRQLESDWDTLVSRVHSAPLPYGSVTRLKELRTRYLQSRAGLTTQQWEGAIAEGISGFQKGKRHLVLPTLASSSPRKSSFHTGISKLSPVITTQQKSVQELIERYKYKVAAIQVKPQNKKKRKEADDNSDVVTLEPPRRQRFQWTPEYDELARDASAVIKARCRTWHRMDWTALNQLFPFLPRNNVRQRLVTLRQESGGESYLRLLEDKWHELWLEHRGTEALPDDNPGDPADFDAIAHVEFLRKYIDKRALRVGLSKADIPHASGAVLTGTTSDFVSRWDVSENPRPTNKMDFMWSSIGDEHREKTLLGEAFSIKKDTRSVPTSTDSRSNGIAESALKMTLATHEEEYDAKDAALLLSGVGQQDVRRASEDLLARGIISEVAKSHRKKPGRKLKISDLNEEASGGSFRPDFFSEACVIEDELDDWREWATIATGGEMAALVELVSEGKVELKIDVSEPAAHRQELDWNSKKVDDNQIETVLEIRYHALTEDMVGLSESPSGWPIPKQVPMDIDGATSMEHGLNNGVPSPCRQTSQGVITCSACIDAEQEHFLAGLDSEEKASSLEVIERLDRVGCDGMGCQEVFAHLPKSHDIQRAAHRLTSCNCPLAFWLGYNHPVLVSRRHIAAWSVAIPTSPLHHLVFPRRWLNIKGEKMHDVWNAGLRAVAGVLIARPGIPQVELRQRLVSVYDRQELNDLLSYLWTERFIAKRVAPEDADLGSRDFRAMGGTIEQKIYWFLNASAWYRVNE